MKNYVVELGFELAIPGFAVRRITNCAMESGKLILVLQTIFFTVAVSLMVDIEVI